MPFCGDTLLLMSCSNRCGNWEPLYCDFPGGSGSKKSGCSAGDLSSTPGLRRSPGEGNGNPFQYYGLENPMDRGALAGCSPWGRKRVGYNRATHTHSLILCREPCLKACEAGPAAAHLRPVGGDMKSCEFSSEHVGQGIDSLTLSLTESLSLPHLCLHQ